MLCGNCARRTPQRQARRRRTQRPLRVFALGCLIFRESRQMNSAAVFPFSQEAYRLKSGSANLPAAAGALRDAIRENGVPGRGLLSFGAGFAVELRVKNTT